MILFDGKPLRIPPMGFLNTGNICYFNALFQSLLSSQNFIRYLLHHPTPEFLQFFSFIVDGQWDTVFTTRLLQTYNLFAPNQSSSEYFVKFVDVLHLEAIFECTFLMTTTCGGCGVCTYSRDKSYNLLVDANFREFFQFEETINEVKCEHCKSRQQVQRVRTLEGVPPVIAISFNKYSQKRDTVYPRRFRIDDMTYTLVATVEHFGVLGAGHYVARCTRDDGLFLADDSKMHPIGDIESSSNTYMVFYERLKTSE